MGLALSAPIRILRDMSALTSNRKSSADGATVTGMLELLPNSFHPEGGEQVPPHLIGARINRFGTLPLDTEYRPDGGGLVIEYVPNRSAKVRQVIFGFTEEGMWVISDKEI